MCLLTTLNISLMLGLVLRFSWPLSEMPSTYAWQIQQTRPRLAELRPRNQREAASPGAGSSARGERHGLGR